MNAGRLRDAHWFPSWVSEADVANLLGTRVFEWILDQGVQLDTPGTRDLRWDNYRSLRLDEIFSEDTKVLSMLDPANVRYDLQQGSFLYNGNLRQMNESDPYHGEQKYTFLYGTTSKRLPDQTEQTAVGATLIPFLLKNPDRVAGEFVAHADGQSDGAVPVASMAGVGLGGATYHAGDVDHEEYYGPVHGRATALATFTAWGLGESRCDCPQVLIEQPADSSTVEAGDALEIVAWYALDPALDLEPGGSIERAEAFFQILGSDSVEPLGALEVSDRGQLTGSYRMPDLGEGEHLLVVRATLEDGTHLDSEGNWVGAGEWVIPVICPDGRPPGPDGCDYPLSPRATEQGRRGIQVVHHRALGREEHGSMAEENRGTRPSRGRCACRSFAIARSSRNWRSPSAFPLHCSLSSCSSSRTATSRGSGSRWSWWGRCSSWTYVFIQVVYGGTYDVAYEVDERGVLAYTQSAQAKRSATVNALTVLLGLFAARPSLAGAGCDAGARQRLLPWEDVRRVHYEPERRTIMPAPPARADASSATRRTTNRSNRRCAGTPHRRTASLPEGWRRCTQRRQPSGRSRAPRPITARRPPTAAA